jgi:hypothetical protein
MFSVIIPAHNEEQVIGRCLDRLLADAPETGFEVIVAANGCTDRTVEIAERYGPIVTVLDLPVASKHGALNAGDAAATGFPRAYLDADIEMSWQSLAAVGEALDRTGAKVGAPTIHVDLKGCPWYVKSFYKVWLSLPWMREAPVGSGVFVLSEAGHEQMGSFPAITNDDQYVHDLFPASERVCTTGGTFTVRAPRSFQSLVSRRTRTLAGSMELEERFGDLPGKAPRTGLLGLVRSSPSLIPHLPVFVAVAALASRAADRKRLSQSTSWERDDSSREPLRDTP